MEPFHSKIHDTGLIILRCIGGIMIIISLVVLILVCRRTNHWKYAENNAYKNVVDISSTK